jgi:hypothetical protein
MFLTNPQALGVQRRGKVLRILVATLYGRMGVMYIIQAEQSSMFLTNPQALGVQKRGMA